MDNSPKLSATKSLYIFFFLIFFTQNPHRLCAQTDLQGKLAPGPEPTVELDFDYPDQVNAGDSFIFTIQLQKASSYSAAGTIVGELYGGMLAQKSTISNATYSANGKRFSIRWQELNNSNIFSFPVKMSTQETQVGVYPVKIKYTDEKGLQIKSNAGIFIFNANEMPVPPIAGPDVENPYNVDLVYEDEIFFDEDYTIDIVIAKGKNTGGAKVFLQVPPASQVTVPEYPDHRYEQTGGNLCILLNSMPASPRFSIRCHVKNTSSVRSVYPLRATVEFLDGSRISKDDFIMVTGKKSNARGGVPQRTGTIRSVNAATNADSTSLFAELDKLLETWKKSTGQLKTPKPSGDTRPEYEKSGPVAEVLNREVVFYSVQVAASEVVMQSIENQLRSKGIEERILEDYDGEIYRYSVGDFETLQEAQQMKAQLVGTGFPDAFIVEYVNGVRKRSHY